MAELPPPPEVQPADGPTPETATAPSPRRRFWPRLVLWVAGGLGGLVLLAGLMIAGLDTAPGHRFVARQIGALKLASGLSFRIGRIDGSLYGAMVLHDVEARDPAGTFASAQRIELDWRPWRYLSNRIEIHRLTSPALHIARMPQLRSTPRDPNAPILPDIDIAIDQFDIARIDVDRAVTGQRHLASLKGRAQLADGRVQLAVDGGTIAAPGLAGGDRLTARIDAVPDRNRLDADLRLDAPRGGLVAGLAKVDAPMTARLAGRGSWASWQGDAAATIGGKSVAQLRLRADNGRFRVDGKTWPGAYLKGPVERLAQPHLDVAADLRLADRTIDGTLKLTSSALAAEARGKVDLANNRFDALQVEAALRTPGAIAPNLNGRDVRAALRLDGGFSRPLVDYKLSAATLGFGSTIVEGLYAEGRARVDAERILVPVRARAARIAGLNAAAGALVTHVQLGGDLAIAGDRVLSDNLRLRSDRVDATAIIAADISAGRYTGAIRGRINDYAINGVGVVNLTTDAKLYATRGGWGIGGRVAAETRRITNTTLRDLLGGRAVASAQVDLGPQGIVTVRDLRLKAPEFRVLRGAGRYDPAGPIRIDAEAVSTRYGPLSAQLTGTLTAPELLLHADRPGLGIGLADLEARVKGQGGAWAVQARGGTSYGPFDADVLVRTGKAIEVAVNRAHFAGMEIAGTIAQTNGGPFAGTLAFRGSGVDGRALLSDASGVQQLDLQAVANNAQIPGDAQLAIGRALVSARVMLGKTPQVVADVQLAALRKGDLTVKTGRARIDYQGGRGTAQLVLHGASGVAFDLAANARMTPELWVAAVQGQAGGVRFHSVQPAQIHIAGDEYRLAPAQIDFDQGSLRLAGSYGRGMAVQARLDKLDLTLFNTLTSGLGVGGTATGSLDFAQPEGAAFPSADARLEIRDFTRASLATVSTPVDVSFVGKLLPDGGDARALVRRGGTTIGRLIATLRPLPPGSGPWTERLLGAPLSGGIRYNGPAAFPFSLAGLANQHVAGPVGIAADFSGRVRAPQLQGIVRGENLSYAHDSYGTQITGIRLDGRFSNDMLILDQLSGRAGEGTIRAQGSLGLSADAGYPLSITVDLDNARLARSLALGATATGRLTVTKNDQVAKIAGKLKIPEAHYEIVRQGAAEVPELTGVRRKSEVAAGDTPAARRSRIKTVFDLDIDLSADNRLFVNGMGLESEWSARVNIGGTTAAPQVRGNMQVERGTYSFASRRFELTRGDIRFQGSTITNPSVNIAATTTAEGVTAILTVSGTAQKPQIAFSSTPSLPQEEVLARLFFGTNVTNLSATEAIQLAAAVNSLSNPGGGLNPLGQLKAATGIDRLRILGADDTSGRGTSLAAGKYITNNIYIEIITDARGFTATQLEIALSRALSVLSQTSSFGGSSVSVRYSRDY